MIIVFFVFLISVTLLYQPSASLAVNFSDFILPSSGHSHSLSTGENIRFSSDGGSGPGSPVRMYKNNNYEQFFLGADGSVYRREDTSWATPDWQDVICSGNGRASYTLASCSLNYSSGQIVTTDGIRWLPPSGTVGQIFPSESFKVVPISQSSANSGSRQVCSLSNLSGYPSSCTNQQVEFTAHYQPGEFTFCTGIANQDELILLTVTSGPGSGDTFYFMKGWGMVGFEAEGLETGLMGPGADASLCGTCNSQNPSFPPIRISTADPSHPKTALNPLNKHPDNYPPKQEYITICDNQQDISQTFEPQSAGGSSPPQPYTATELKKEIKNSDFTSNYPVKLANLFKPFPNPLADPKKLTKDFTSFKSGISQRMTSAASQEKSKKDFLLEVTKGNQVDEQIAWDCSGVCRPLACKKPDCRPVYLSELGTHYGIPSNPPVSAPLSPLCYQKLFRSLNFTYSGSLNSKVNVKNVSTLTGDVSEQSYDRMVPAGSNLKNQQVPKIAMPVNQKNLSSQVCRTVPKPPTQNTTNPLQFNFFHAISELIDSVKSVTRKVSYTEAQDPQAVRGMETQETFFSNLLPQKTNEQVKTNPDSSTGDKINLKDAGGGRLENKINLYTKFLYPASWQN